MEFWTMPRRLNVETLLSFTPIAGANRARCGKVGFYDYVAKCSWGVGPNQDDYVHNECVCDELLRQAGVPVPPSREYKVDFGRGLESVRLMERVFRYPCCADLPPWNQYDQQKMARRYYALMAFVGKTAAFEKPNVAYDSHEKVYFVNNSHSLKYADLNQPRDHWNSIDPNDEFFGAGALVGDEANNPTLGRIFRYCTLKTLKGDVQSLDFEKLVSKLPTEYALSLAEMAKNWNDWKNDGLDLVVKHSDSGRMPWTQSVLSGKDIMTTNTPLAEAFAFEAVGRVPYVWVNPYDAVFDGMVGLRVYCEKNDAVASGRPYRVMKGIDIITGVVAGEYGGRFALQNADGGWQVVTGKELDEMMRHVKFRMNDDNEPLPENKPPRKFKGYDGFVNVSFDNKRRNGTIEFETEDEYQRITIFPAEENYEFNNYYADSTPFVNSNALGCSFSSDCLYGGWVKGCGRSIFTFELQDICEQIEHLLVKDGGFKAVVSLKALEKTVFIQRINDDAFKFTLVDNGVECPMATQQLISRGELWKIHNFFEKCFKMFPVVGLPGPNERIASDSYTLRMLKNQSKHPEGSV